jgi:hypothetical protein
MLNFSACMTCVLWFDLDISTSGQWQHVEPGENCEYCTDLTGRPNYTPDVLFTFTV